MKVLVLCSDYPPRNTIGAQRPYSWYMYFPYSNIDITVITKNWGDFKDYQIDDKHNDLRHIIFTKNIMHPSDRIISKYGETKFATFRKVLTFLVKSCVFFVPFFDHHRSIYLEASKYLNKNEVDWIICTGEPFILFKYGYKLSKKYKTKWVADFRDGWYHNHITSIDRRIFMNFIRCIEKWFEKKYIKNTSLILTVDPLLADKLTNFHSRKSKVVYNGFDYQYKAKSNISYDLPLVLLHAGTLTPGQRVEFLIEAVEELYTEGKIKEGDIKIRFIGLKEQIKQNERVKNLSKNINRFISIEQKLSRNESLHVSSSADVLLTFTEKKNYSIFAKNYDYMAVGRPIWILPNDHSILNDLLVNQLEIGRSFSDKENLKSEILELVELKRRNKGILAYTKGSEQIFDFTREKQTELFSQILMSYKGSIVKEKIIIISYFFPPCGLVAEQRIESWANYFNQFGLYPIIITRNWDHPVRSQANIPKPQGKEIIHVKNENYEVYCLPHNGSVKDKLFYYTSKSKFYFLTKPFTLLELFGQNYFNLFTPFKYLRNQTVYLLKTDPDIKNVIISGNPFILFKFGYQLKNIFPSINWIADYRDGWTTSSFRLKKGLINKVIESIEKKSEIKWLSNVHFITSVTPFYIQKISSFINKPGIVIYNGFNKIYENKLLTQNEFIIVYSGTLYPNQNIEDFCECFIKLINDFKNVRFKLKFIGVAFNKLQAVRVRELMKGYELNIEITERLPYNDVIDIQQQAHVLLMLSYVGAKGVASSKIFEYFSLQRPIVVFMNDHDIIEKLIKQTNSGFICESKTDLYNNLATLVYQYLNEGKTTCNIKLDEVMKYSRENQAFLFVQSILKNTER